MKKISTVRGEIESTELGFCQCHEHLWISRGYPATIADNQRIDDSKNSSDELVRYRLAGGRAIVDAQPVGCGRDAAMLRDISAFSDVSIVASTGFHKALFYPNDHWIYDFSAEQLARLFIEELTSGMYIECDTTPPSRQSGIKAGQIKSALDSGEFTKHYQKCFEAAAFAATQTDAALMVHIEKDSNPIFLADLLEKNHVRPTRTIFCHMDRSVHDLGIHKELCERGITMEYDTIARTKYHDDQTELQILQKMLESGFENQILMSLDTTRDRLISYGNADAPGLDYILRVFLPFLRANGVDQSVIDKIFLENPANIFAYCPRNRVLAT